jgi:hypothetical protein
MPSQATTAGATAVTNPPALSKSEQTNKNKKPFFTIFDAPTDYGCEFSRYIFVVFREREIPNVLIARTPMQKTSRVFISNFSWTCSEIKSQEENLLH